MNVNRMTEFFRKQYRDASERDVAADATVVEKLNDDGVKEGEINVTAAFHRIRVAMGVFWELAGLTNRATFNDVGNDLDELESIIDDLIETNIDHSQTINEVTDELIRVSRQLNELRNQG